MEVPSRFFTPISILISSRLMLVLGAYGLIMGLLRIEIAGQNRDSLKGINWQTKGSFS